MPLTRRRLLYTSLPLLASAQNSSGTSETWTFDRLDTIAGHAVTVLGHPRIIDTPLGKATQFNGVDDALFFDVHPLAGAAAFTWEVLFRPDGDGRPEQRFLHFQTRNEATRLLFETRVADGQWCLDSYAHSGDKGLALMDRAKLHPTDRWYHAAAVYDGKEFRNYVNGIQEGSGLVTLQPQGPGEASVGTRINKRDYFKGAIRLTRMTRQALPPAGFLKPPSN